MAKRKPWVKQWSKTASRDGGRFCPVDDRPMADRQLQARLPQDLDDAVRSRAADRGETVSATVRDLLDLAVDLDGLDRELLEKCPDADWINEAIAQRLRKTVKTV